MVWRNRILARINVLAGADGSSVLTGIGDSVHIEGVAIQVDGSVVLECIIGLLPENNLEEMWRFPAIAPRGGVASAYATSQPFCVPSRQPARRD